jgi:hypothetical protein
MATPWLRDLRSRKHDNITEVDIVSQKKLQEIARRPFITETARLGTVTAVIDIVARLTDA